MGKAAAAVWRSSLVADTDVATGRLLGRGLPAEGFRVGVAHSAAAVLDRVEHNRPDAIVLGGDLPDMAALDLIGRLDTMAGPPLLMLLTDARDGEMVRVLDAGAADCMHKPFLVRELAARLRKLVRRRLMSQGLPTRIRTDTLDLDCVLWRASVRGVAVRLSGKEQAVMRMLVEDVGIVVSNRDLLARIWGSPHLAAAGRIQHVVASLRRKLDLTLADAVGLLSVPQIGYRLVVPALVPPAPVSSVTDRTRE